jgi:hypothetical protein
MERTPLPEEEQRRLFLEKGTDFFNINSYKNIPNILDMLTHQVGALEVAMKQASASSDKLAAALNKLTAAGIAISAIGLVIAIIAMIIHHS